jgi:hypothetical protein
MTASLPPPTLTKAAAPMRSQATLSCIDALPAPDPALTSNKLTLPATNSV